MNRKNFGFVSAALTVFFFYTSCTKIDTTDIGDDLIPAVDNVHTFDTVLDVISDNLLLPDSTRLRATEIHALGFISADPVFGRSTAAIYVDIRPRIFGTRPFPEKDSVVSVDSVVFSLANTATYGDTNSAARFNVYEIDHEEAGNFKDSIKGFYIGQRYFAVDPLLKVHDQDLTKLNDEDSMYDGNTKILVKNQMRIRLDTSFGWRFINYDTSVYKTDSSFRTKFIGFGIIPDTSVGSSNALAYFNLADNDNTKLTFYYKAKKSGKTDTLVTSFVFSNYSNANIIHRNFAGTEFENALNNGLPNDDKLYMYTSPGSYASLKIPGLNTLSNRIIHRAELIVEKLADPGDQKFAPPSYLFLDAIDTANRFVTIPNDFTYSSSFYNIERFGGVFKNSKYIFDISRYVQGIITRKDPVYTLRLYAPYKTNSTQVQPGFGLITPAPPSELTGMIVNHPIMNGRIVVAGGNYPDPNKKLRVRIIYSKI